MDVAEDFWTMVLHHQHGLSSVPGRNVGIAVAALDFLANVTGNMDTATLVNEAQVREIIALSLRDELTGIPSTGYTLSAAFMHRISLQAPAFVKCPGTS